MKTLLVGSFHFAKYNGEYYFQAPYTKGFFDDYLKVFPELLVLAKVFELNEKIQEDYSAHLNPRIEVIEIPFKKGMFRSLTQLFLKYHLISKQLKTADKYILRISQIESNFIYLLFLRKKIYVVEVVNDPDQFKLRPILKYVNLSIFKKVLKNAFARSFVTEKYLQNKYVNPMNDKSKLDTFYSSVRIYHSEQRITFKNINKKFNLVHIANNIDNNIKGTIETLNILKKLVLSNPKFHLTIIGDGSLINKIKSLTRSYQLTSHVNFTGKLNDKEEYYNEIANNHILVLPTKFEGLPRTIIESMSIGLPVISSNISGIPELIDYKYLCPPTDIDCFFEKIIFISNNDKILQKISLKNLERSKKYHAKILDKKRYDFYNYYNKV